MAANLLPAVTSACGHCGSRRFGAVGEDAATQGENGSGGGVACLDCGMMAAMAATVVDAAVLDTREPYDIAERTTQWVPLRLLSSSPSASSAAALAKRRLAEEIRGVCMFLKASDLGGQATAMYERLVGGSARVTRKAHKIAVCVYIVARQSNRPVTLTECAVAGNVETGAMCAEYLAAKRLLGITLDNTGVPELLVERLVHCVHADLASPAARGLKQRAFQLLKLAAKTNYTTGRQPQMVAVAAVTICAEALGAKETATSLHQRLCDCLSIKVSSTLNQRRKELLRVLLESKGVLPYDEGIVTAGNLLKHVNEILMIAAAFPVDADEEEDEDDDDNAKKRPRINYDERLAPQRSFPSNTAAAPAVEGSAFVDDNAPIDDDELDDYIRTPAEVASVISFRNL